MKYTVQFLNKIIDVKQYLLINNTLFVLSNHKLRIIENHKETTIEFKSDNIYKVGNNIFSARDFYYNTILEKVIVIEKMKSYYYTNDFYEDQLLFSNLDMAVYSLRNNEIEYKIPFSEEYGLNFLYKDKFIARGDDYYALYSLKDYKNPLWQHSFSELLGGEKIETVGDIKIFNDSLFIPLIDNKNNKNKATVEIDIETGIVKNQFKDFYGKLILDTYYLYVAHYYEVKKLNLETKEIIEFNFEDILKPLNLQIHWNKSVIENNKLYFIEGHWATTNRMGIIDLNTQELIWQKDFEIDEDINNSIMEIKVSNGRMFVHCSDNTLHIFEKE